MGGSSQDVDRSMALGYYAEVNADDKIVLGSSSVNSIGGYASWTVYSDKRLKENIVYNDALGLDFINQLQTVSYNFIEDLNKKRRDGLIAQDVQQTMNNLNVDFSGLIIDNDPEQTLNLSYEEFVIPLINAVQEQQKMIEQQQEMILKMQEQFDALTGEK